MGQNATRELSVNLILVKDLYRNRRFSVALILDIS